MIMKKRQEKSEHFNKAVFALSLNLKNDFAYCEKSSQLFHIADESFLQDHQTASPIDGFSRDISS